jgi:sec-independent protein translocase protein TatA
MGLDNPLHIAFLLIILLLVFGAKRLPEIGRSIGTGMREFKESISGENTHTLTHTIPQQQAPVQPAQYQQAPYQQAPAQPIGGQAPAPQQPAPVAQAPAEPTPQA